jgi:hypothetical protein
VRKQSRFVNILAAAWCLGMPFKVARQRAATFRGIFVNFDFPMYLYHRFLQCNSLYCQFTGGQWPFSMHSPSIQMSALPQHDWPNSAGYTPEHGFVVRRDLLPCGAMTFNEHVQPRRVP